MHRLVNANDCTCPCPGLPSLRVCCMPLLGRLQTTPGILQPVGLGGAVMSGLIVSFTCITITIMIYTMTLSLYISISILSNISLSSLLTCWTLSALSVLRRSSACWMSSVIALRIITISLLFHGHKAKLSHLECLQSCVMSVLLILSS